MKVFTKYHLSVLSAALVYALYLVFNKVFLTKGISAINFAAGGAMFGGLFSAGYLIMTKKIKEIMKINKTNWIRIVFLGIIMGVVYKLVLFYGQSLVTATNTGFLLRTSPLFALVLGYLFMKESVRLKECLIMFLMIVGIFLLITAGQFKPQFGNWLLVFGGALIGFDHSFSRLIVKSGVKPDILVSLTIIVGGILLSSYWLIAGKPDLHYWLTYLISGLLMFMAILLRDIGLKKVKASITSSILLFSPLFSAIIGIISLKERVELVQLFGGFIVLFGGYWLIRIQKNTS
jgi:drug/metabolite transporter (DMT)-like permease